MGREGSGKGLGFCLGCRLQINSKIQFFIPVFADLTLHFAFFHKSNGPDVEKWNICTYINI